MQDRTVDATPAVTAVRILAAADSVAAILRELRRTVRGRPSDAARARWPTTRTRAGAAGTRGRTTATRGRTTTTRTGGATGPRVPARARPRAATVARITAPGAVVRTAAGSIAAAAGRRAARGAPDPGTLSSGAARGFSTVPRSPPTGATARAAAAAYEQRSEGQTQTQRPQSSQPRHPPSVAQTNRNRHEHPATSGGYPDSPALDRGLRPHQRLPKRDHITYTRRNFSSGANAPARPSS